MAANQAAFLAAYAMTLNVEWSCAAAKVVRSCHYRWLAEDPTYAPRFAAARRDAIERAEAAAFKRAVEGVARLKIANGQPVIDPRAASVDGKPVYLEEVHYSDELLKFILRGNDERYRDKTELSGPGGGAIPVGIANDERRQALNEAMKDPKVAEKLIALSEAMADTAFKQEG